MGCDSGCSWYSGALGVWVEGGKKPWVSWRGVKLTALATHFWVEEIKPLGSTDISVIVFGQCRALPSIVFGVVDGVDPARCSSFFPPILPQPPCFRAPFPLPLFSKDLSKMSSEPLHWGCFSQIPADNPLLTFWIIPSFKPFLLMLH